MKANFLILSKYVIMNSSTRILCFAFCMFISGSVFSQGNPGDWIYYNTANSGIPSNKILSVDIDESGNIWMGTYAGGLARFDGNTWTVYNTGNSDIPYDNIHDVAAVGEDVWLAAKIPLQAASLLIRFDGESWSIWDDFGYIHTISSWQDGFVWVSSYNIGLIKFDGTNRVDFNDQNSCLYQNAATTHLIDYETGIKWVGLSNIYVTGGEEAGLVKMVGDSACTNYTYSNSGFPTDGSVQQIIKNSADSSSIWIAHNKGLTLFDGENFTFNGPLTPGESGPNAIAMDQYNYLWAATPFSGTARNKLDGTGWERFGGLPDYFVREMIVTPDNRIWATTESKGLAVFGNALTETEDQFREESRMECWPTATRSQINVALKSDDFQEWAFLIFDALGKKVLQENISTGKQIITLDGNLPGGVYFYVALNEEKQLAGKGKLILLR
ncbi:MAG: hypothetical protein KDD10_17160 [Phaeodactylibacter sp.]|nr:hypothetical protein [Phaeodactylibacter sp.]MCB9296133.1 hypothetical protein [Lewinellaceae bacterium]